MGQMQRISKNNTSVRVNGSDLSVVLHGTEVVSVKGGVITLCTGGWRTSTTKARMNQAANQYGLGYRVSQDKGDWFVSWKGAVLTFEGNTITLP